MPKIGNLISKLQIEGKTFNNPQWWSTKSKLKSSIKSMENFKTHLNAKNFYTVNKNDSQTAEMLIRSFKSDLDAPKYGEFASWNPMFKKEKNMVVYPDQDTFLTIPTRQDNIVKKSHRDISDLNILKHIKLPF